MARTLVVGIGDIHGRFIRVNQWISALETALGRSIDLVFAVGDIEAFPSPDEHLRKAVRRNTAAEFAEFVAGTMEFVRPIYFIGGNNEDFAALHGIPMGGEIAADVHYLGRAGLVVLAGLRVAFLSGIHAPRFFDAPIEVPRTVQTAKQAGYFRAGEVASVQNEHDVDLMLVHEWPRGLVPRKGAQTHGEGRELRAFRFPWIGNAVTRAVVDRVQPRWLWCGHSHVAFAAEVRHADEHVTRVACLDQAAGPDGAVFWLEFEGRVPMRAGWGIDGRACWQAGEPWGPARTPEEGYVRGDGSGE